ncbi:MAG TPA: ABC transporter permease [Bryobacteraceae bacterium]|nr:ABC transporter permease [Bryobacteraceae bacterium]
MEFLRFLRRAQWDEERAREIEAYIEQETADNLACGMNAEEARQAARRKLGNAVLIREEIYHMNSLGAVEDLWRDVRYGVRALRRSPAFTSVALLSLALGIGASTSIFSAVYGILISPYPYARSNEIWAPEVRALKTGRGAPFSFHQMRDYVELKKLPAFAETMATRPDRKLLTGDRPPENFTAVAVTANAFQFLGVAPVLGRTIQPSDVRADGQPEPVIVITYNAWQRLFDGSPGALGTKLVLDAQPFTVIGVMPPRFGWWNNDGGWIVLPEDSRDSRGVAAIVRLNKRVSPKVAEEQLQALHLRLAKERPADFPKDGFRTVLHNYMDITAVSGDMRASLRLLFGAVGFLLLIACANVANLQLARGTARAHEIAVRMSIGADRGRVFRQFLTESVTLSVAGGVLGVLFAFAITKTIVAMMPESYVPNESRIELNVYVLLFSAAVSMITGIVFGLAPALQCSRPSLVDGLKDGGRSVAGGGPAGRTRQTLVIAEIALSVVLLMGAGLTVRGFLEMQKLDAGFRTDRVLMLTLQMPVKRYSNETQRVAFAKRVLAAIGELPGVRSAAIGNGGFPFGGAQSGYAIEGQPNDAPGTLLLSLISADYPQTLGIGLRTGRQLTEQDIDHAEPVALINDAARKLWPAGVDPIGARVRLDLLVRANATPVALGRAYPSVTVVGIIADTRNAGLRNPPAPAAYLPYTLVPVPNRTLAIRTQGDPAALLHAVRERLRAIDREQPLDRPITLEEVLGMEAVQPRFNMALFGLFGALGLAMAAVGIYSVLSYIVAQRTHEIGIRMALGAGGRDVLRLIFSMGGRLVMIGLGIGLALTILLARLLRSEVFQVPETDVLALAGVVLLLCCAAFLACFVPARRAARLDPMSALRHE